MNILILNPGSSTLKFQLFCIQSSSKLESVKKGCIRQVFSQGNTPDPFGEATRQILNSLGSIDLTAIGVRVVHGGEQAAEVTPITEDLIGRISDQRELAPLHTDIALQCIRAVTSQRANVRHFAVFDTVFHNTMPQIAKGYALPFEFREFRRFGFHGISYRFVSRQLQQELEAIGRTSSRLVICHLGNGSSVCAIKDGQSVDTSMGFTPLEGLIMGTRSGDIDPGLVLYLARARGMSIGEIEDLLNHRSGLLGLSGLSADIRDLEAAAAQGDAQADRAIEAFAYRIRKYVGAYAAVLGGLDALVFTGGIGEHSAGVRRRVIRELNFLGLRLNPKLNDNAKGVSNTLISDGDVPVWMIPTDEERQIAEDIAAVLHA